MKSIDPEAVARGTPSLGHGKARYVMIGGFLGAGKTTSVAKLGHYLRGKGLRVGLITNDQGQELVDTATLRSQGFATEEIRGGCFCCRFNSLTDAANHLTEATQPDVFIAEPVGSCTDLIATVSYPLRRMYGNNFAVTPLSVLVDPIRARRIFGLETTGGRFSEKVLYIYRKQLEEADFIVINKSELLPASKLSQLHSVLQAEFPKATIFTVSARDGTGLEEWFECILTREPRNGSALHLDYEAYAEGEALLGWLNCTIKFSSVKYWDSSKLLLELATSIQALLKAEQAEVAHLKMTLDPDEELADIAVVSLVRNDFVPELSQQLSEPIESGDMILNLRAEADPEVLHSAVNKALMAIMNKHPHLFVRMEHCEHFRPGKPQPTHRISEMHPGEN